MTTTEKKPLAYLGKITSATFGRGGYQDVQFGLSLSFSFDRTGINTFIGAWDPANVSSEHAKWTEEDRDRDLVKLGREVARILHEAKKNDVTKLIGVPVEVFIDSNNSLANWRVLTEVL